MEPEYRLATINNLDELVQTRIRVLRAANRLSDSVDMSAVASESKQYYQQSLMDNTHVAYLIYVCNKFVGAGGVSFYQVLPTFHNPTGRRAHIMNMYTVPEYRRRGIGLRTLDLLVNAAKTQGIYSITLEATTMGKPLYEKYGFVQMNDEMFLPELN